MVFLIETFKVQIPLFYYNYWIINKYIRVRLDTTYFCWNWKHCSKIIFKCENSTVRPIFNENVVKKWSLWDLWTMHECTIHKRKVKCCGLKKKKKKKKNLILKRRHAKRRIQTKYIFYKSLVHVGALILFLSPLEKLVIVNLFSDLDHI